MMRKTPKRDWDCLATEQFKSFQELQDPLLNPSVFSLQKRGRPFILDTYASKTSMVVTMVQQKSLENEKECESIGIRIKTYEDSKRR